METNNLHSESKALLLKYDSEKAVKSFTFWNWTELVDTVADSHPTHRWEFKQVTLMIIENEL